jgi:hypothetical protein
MFKALAIKALVPVFLAAGITCAASAQADTQADQRFISVLDGHGVSAKYSDIQLAIQSAHMACSELAAGKSVVAVQLDVVGQNQNLSRADASWVVYGAQQAYCPS